MNDFTSLKNAFFASRIQILGLFLLISSCSSFLTAPGLAEPELEEGSNSEEVPYDEAPRSISPTFFQIRRSGPDYNTETTYIGIRAFIDTDGSVKETILVQGLPGMSNLEMEAVNLVKFSTWRPATRNGQPIGAWVTVTVRISLRWTSN